MSHRRREALLVLGSNIDPAAHVPQAIGLLEARFDVIALSSRYASAAVGGRGPQPEFTNLAARVRTDLPPRALREACRRVEEACGRRRSADRYAPRTMDVDVVLVPDLVLEEPDLCLPDPDLAVLPHLLLPCADAWPDVLHPLLGRSLLALCSELEPGPTAAVRRLGDAGPRRAGAGPAGGGRRAEPDPS